MAGGGNSTHNCLMNYSVALGSSYCCVKNDGLYELAKVLFGRQLLHKGKIKKSTICQMSYVFNYESIFACNKKIHCNVATLVANLKNLNHMIQTL